jgi:hypothetical protein
MMRAYTTLTQLHAMFLMGLRFDMVSNGEKMAIITLLYQHYVICSPTLYIWVTGVRTNVFLSGITIQL